MPQIAELILTSKTDSLLRGKKALEDTAKAGAATEKAVGGAEQGFVRAGRGAATAAPMLNGFNSAADRTRALAIAGARALAGMAATYASFQAAGASVSMAREFNAALAETSTLIAGTPEQIDAITASARSMAREFGGSAKSQVEGFYAAISAGADGVETAAALLDQANKLAIGGITDVATGVDALTTATNAYGPAVLSAAQASDSMFIAMRAGKTTIGELAGSLGQIVPIASSAGVSFDELTAGIAALTTQGLSTASATTGLRQVIASVIAPTKQATDAAKALGVEFDVGALKSKGLAEFLDDVITKTGGSEAAMAQLFGSVEALGAALAFAGGAGDTFNDILADMQTKAGATDAAYLKMSKSLDQRWNKLTAAATDIALGFGNALLTIVVPAMEAIAGVAVTVGQNLDVIGIALVGFAATQIPAAVAGLAAMTAGMTTSAVATGVFTAAINLARGAVIALGGPLGIIWGILGAGAATWLLWNKGTKDAEQASYDAAAGTAALMGELDAFSTSAAPTAAAKAIDLANANHKLAASGFEAAKGELAKRRAMLEAARAADLDAIENGQIGGPFATETLQAGLAARKYDAALAQMAKAEASLAQAMRDRKVAATTVTGSMSEVMSANKAALDTTRNHTIELDVNTGGLEKNATATQSAIEKLKQQIEQERALLGLSDEAKMQLEARHEVERALAADKAVWNEAEIAALTNQIVLTKKLGEQAQNAARVTGVIFDGIAKGDLGSIGSGLLSQAQSGFSDLLKTASGHAEGFFAGLKSGFSDAISGIGSALSGTGSLFAKLGGAISSAMPIIGAISAAFSFFKKTVRNLDVGLRVAGQGVEDLIAQTYKLDEITRFWGLSKKERKTYETASAELADPIQAAVNRIGQSVMDLSDTLGLASENVASTAFEFEISTKGLSDEQIQSAIAAEMERLGDTFANAVIGSFTEFLPDEAEIARIEKQIAGTFNIGGRGGEDRGAMERAQLEQQKVAAQTAIEVVHLNEAFAELVREGEGSYDTLVALVGSLELVNSSFSDLGFALFDTALAGANAARVFADAVGGWDAFSEKMSFFVDTFYSDSEKLEIVTGRIHDAFAGLDPNNISTAMHSRGQFKELADWAGSGAAVNEDQADLFAALINAAPLIDQMFSLQEAIAAAGNAVDGTTDQIDQFNSIASEREQLERQLLQLQGDTAGLRALELEQVNEANRSILEQIHNLEDQQEAQRAADEAAAQAARDAEALASQRASMEAEILRLEGNTVALRQIELDALDSSLVPLQERIYQLQDEAEASAEAKRVADELTRQQEAAARERSTLEAELLRLQGDTAALRSLELAALDPANRELQERIWKLTDEQAALAAIEATANERIGLERRLLQLQGDTAALRERELAELDPSNRALLERIFALEDLQNAEADQARLDHEAATVAKAIADQRTQMTKQLLNLEGDVAGVRALELAALDPSLHALQKRIWGLEDEAEATEAARVAAEKAAGERDSLEVRALELQGNTAALRARELAALEPVNRALQEYVWGLEAENEAREKANQLAEEQSSEKYGLHTRLLELLGDTDQLRARELELLFPANRALQEQIWALEDATEASDNFTAKLEQMRSEMRDALSLVERLIGAEINAIQSKAQARIEALQSEIDMARDMANVARDTLQGAFDVVRASIDADRTMVVAGYTAAIERLDNRMEAATANVDRLRGVFDLLDGALAGRALGGVRREQARYMEAQSYIRGLSGVPSDTGALEAAIQALSGDGERFYSNSTDFEFDFLRTNAALSNLRGQAGNQLSDAERQVTAIEGAKAAREAQHEREMSRLDDQLAIAQGIYDEALGNTINLVDVGTGIAGLRSAADLYTSLADQLLAIETTAGAEIAAIGVAADMQIGLLEDQLSAARKSVEIAEGTFESIETIQAAIDHLNQTITAFSEANDQVGSKFASDTTEAIISAPAEVNDLRNENSKENARLLEQNRLLTEEVRELRDDMNQLLKAISSNTKTTANLQQKFDVEGIKERTT